MNLIETIESEKSQRRVVLDLQVVLSSDASPVSELPGSDPHGLGHLPPAEGADRLHLCESPSPGTSE